MTLTPQDKQKLQQAALSVAQFEHSEDAEIKPILIRINTLNDTIRKEEELVRGLQRDRGIEVEGLKKLLMKFIHKDLQS